jgi:hypothetical protein
LDRRWPEVVPIGPNVYRFGLSGWPRPDVRIPDLQELRQSGSGVRILYC